MTIPHPPQTREHATRFHTRQNGHYCKDMVTLAVLRLVTTITLTLTKCHDSQYDYCEPAQDMATLGPSSQHTNKATKVSQITIPQFLRLQIINLFLNIISTCSFTHDSN